MNSDNITAIIVSAMVCITFAFATYRATLHDTHLSTTASCIERIAKEQGYKGNPSGEEAWTLFASQCR